MIRLGFGRRGEARTAVTLTDEEAIQLRDQLLSRYPLKPLTDVGRAALAVEEARAAHCLAVACGKAGSS